MLHTGGTPFKKKRHGSVTKISKEDIGGSSTSKKKHSSRKETNETAGPKLNMDLLMCMKDKDRRKLKKHQIDHHLVDKAYSTLNNSEDFTKKSFDIGDMAVIDGGGIQFRKPRPSLPQQRQSSSRQVFLMD
jgi:hypothetical protein